MLVDRSVYLPWCDTQTIYAGIFTFGTDDTLNRAQRTPFAVIQWINFVIVRRMITVVIVDSSKINLSDPKLCLSLFLLMGLPHKRQFGPKCDEYSVSLLALHSWFFPPGIITLSWLMYIAKIMKNWRSHRWEHYLQANVPSFSLQCFTQSLKKYEMNAKYEKHWTTNTFFVLYE